MADGYINQVTLPDSSKYFLTDSTLKVYSGTCDTAAGTAIKDVTCPEHFSLTKGAVVFVTFDYTNSVTISSIKLRVNSSVTADAKPIKHEYNAAEASLPSAGYLRANQTYQFYYDGTNWVTHVGRDANSTYSYMRPYENTTKGSYSTTAANPNKTASGGWKFDLTAGKYFMYTHYYTNSAASALTLNIAGTGAKPIYINGSPSSNSNHTLPGGQYLVYYDGTNYQFRTDDKISGNIDGDAATVGGFTVGKTVPSTAVFTDTWIPLSTTQGGYVSTAAPDDNKKFLRGDATWATLPAASSTTAGITKIGASGGAAAYSHGTHVTTATVKEALGTSTTHNNQFLRKDGTWQTVNTDSGVTNIGTLTGDVSTSDLISELGLSTAMHFRGIATVTITEGSKTNPTISGYTFGTNGASALAGDVILDKDSQYEYVWTKDGNTGSWELLGSSEAYSLSNHTHGNLTNDGKITTTATIANGDKLVIVDSDNTAKSKIVGSSITFDGSTTSQALTPAGTWETFNNYTHPTGDGNSHVPATGTTNQGLYLKAGATANSASWEEPPVWWGTCETEAATVNKEVTNCPGFVLKNGAVIFVWFKYTNTGAVGNITLNIQGTGAKHIKYLNNASDPANIPGAGYLRANQTYMFRYSDNGTNQFWVVDLQYDTDNNNFASMVGHYNNILARKAITAESLIVGDNTGYEKVAPNVTFNIAYPIVWCTKAVSANSSNYANMYLQHYDRNIATGAKSGFTSSANKVIYLIVTINGNIATIDDNIITDTLPSTEDGKVYITLGKLGAQSTGANYFFLYPIHPMFEYKDGAIHPYNYFAARSKAAALTTKAHDVAYYTDTNGTFGSISSANGALYATSANGTLQWGTLPIGQGGTGKTSWTQWGIVYASATDTLDQVTAGAASNSGLALISKGAAAPEWYGGLSLTGTASASWKANFLGTTDASSTTTAAVTITGGLGVAKTLYVGTQAIIAKIKIGNGASDSQQRTITVTEDNNLIFDAPSSKGFIFQQNATTKIRIVGYTCYPETSTGSSLGITAKRWENAYLTTSLLVGANSTGVNYNTNGLISFIGPGVISSCVTTAGNGYYLIGGGTQYGRWFIETIGTASNGTTQGAQGETVLEIGNGTARAAATSTAGGHNSRGEIRIYGANTHYTNILAQANGDRTCYLPNYGDDMFLVHAGDNDAIGSTKKPVYVAGNGRVTVCNATVGDPYTPMYANAGEFTATSPVQYFTWSISSGKYGVSITDDDGGIFKDNTYNVTLVVLSGESNLNAPLTWTSGEGTFSISTAVAVSGDVTGYAIVARGANITNSITFTQIDSNT